jgi:hypothetical protein
LSLNAEKNWHQNSGAKRHDSISGLDLSAMRSYRSGRIVAAKEPSFRAARFTGLLRRSCASGAGGVSSAGEPKA